MLVRLATALVLLIGCAHSLRPPQQPMPPANPQQRYHAERAACANDTLPAWLDDGAMNAAIDLDRREAQASASNEGFRGATYTSQPPPLSHPGPRASRVEEERRAFQFACEASKRRGP